MKRTDKKFKTVAVKGGKQYVEVRERVQYLATDFDGDYSITTEYQYFPERKMWVVKATLTLEQAGKTCTYTGLAQEIEVTDTRSVNSTSALENAETSAVGRACAFAGIGVDIAIASADEINKATNRQAAPQQPQPVQPKQYTTPAQAAPQKPVEAPKADSKPMTPEQKDSILELLKNPAQTEETIKRVTDKLNTFTYEAAMKTIIILKKTIADKALEKGEAIHA